MITEQNPDRRARSVALMGLVFELALTVFFALLMVWSYSQAVRGLTLLSALGCPVWLFLVLIYHQRVLVREEEFETEQLRKEREGGAGGEAIFDVEEESLLLARRRLQWMYKWMLPGFTVFMILGLALGGLWFWNWSIGARLDSRGWRPVQNVSVLIWFVGGGAFLSFLLSRYAVGMARQPQWRMLRAGAGYLMGITLAAVATCGVLAALHFSNTPVPERALAYILRLLMMLLAAEIALNFVLDFYRPRAPGEEPRPAFDSRLLGLFSEPGGIARSIADAINYQFGFEVSSTWFYKLLERSVVPLIGFAVLTLILASSVIFVDAKEVMVVERFGRKRAVLDSGLHLKWPWPLEIVYPVDTKQIHLLNVGPKISEAQREQIKTDLRLWTNKHEMDPHLNVLVATPELAEYLGAGGEEETETQLPVGQLESRQPQDMLFGQSGEAVAVSMLRISLTLEYRIRDAYQWIRSYEDPEKMLEAIASREINRYCASINVEDILGARRGRIEQELWQAVVQAAEEADLGVEIVFLGLQGAHPPMETAEAFQDVIGAEQKRSEALRNARKESAQRLTKVTGSADLARRLARAIQRMNELEGDESTSEGARQEACQKVNRLFFGGEGERGIGGEASAVIAKARSERWRLENSAHGWAMQFIQEKATKDAAPEVYQLRKYLEALNGSIDHIRKYISAVEGEVSTYNVNVQDSMNVPLEVMVGEQEQP